MASVAASLNLSAGALGLLLPENFPSLAHPVVAGSLIVVGIALEVWAVRLLLASKRAQGAA